MGLEKAIDDDLILKIEGSSSFGELYDMEIRLSEDPNALVSDGLKYDSGKVNFYLMLIQSRMDVVAIKKGCERAGKDMYYA